MESNDFCLRDANKRSVASADIFCEAYHCLRWATRPVLEQPLVAPVPLLPTAGRVTLESDGESLLTFPIGLETMTALATLEPL